ncbi:MAG: cytochrome c [Gammaproteobacteria bacterium]|nr:cytochrome c [Gammaproteobacteria bacterium]
MKIARQNRLLGQVLAIFLLTSTSFISIAEKNDIPLPVSINALMVTLIDHSAHYVWDYGNLVGERKLSSSEWQIIEYYSIQLAASGPLLTLGGSGKMDEEWSTNPDWIIRARELTESAKAALTASRAEDHQALLEAGNRLVEACEGCHDAFKPSVPTEGILHNPEYDHLYHLLSPQTD